MSAPTALVTGASRGIGRAIAMALAGAGFDVAVAARTVHVGEVHDHSPTVHETDLRPLPGSITETAAAIEALGRRALPVAMDLLDRASVAAGATLVLERWGAVDVLVNNGRYVGPGHTDTILETPMDVYDKFLEAQTIAPLLLTKLVLSSMIERGRGTVIGITSGAGYKVPAPKGAGLGYAMSKAAGIRLAELLRHEVGDRGIRAYNVNPGLVITERNALDLDDDFIASHDTTSPEVIGAVVAWLATSPEAASLPPGVIEAQELCRARGLHPACTATG